jgi:hypothetical protein
VWEEPYSLEGARHTVDALKSHWYSTKLDSHIPPAKRAKLERGAGAADGTAMQVVTVDGEESAGGSSGVKGNGVCMHSVCALRPFCIIQKVAEVMVCTLFLTCADQDMGWMGDSSSM